jgi:hypothetical protein
MHFFKLSVKKIGLTILIGVVGFALNYVMYLLSPDLCIDCFQPALITQTIFMLPG